VRFRTRSKAFDLGDMPRTRGDDVLRLSDSESEFSGFENFEIVETPHVAKTVDVISEKRNKSPVKGKKVVKKTKKDTEKPSTSKKQSQSQSLDFNNLSSNDLQILKEKLGLVEQPTEDFFRPNIHVEIDRDDISDNDIDEHGSAVANRISNELFSESDEEDWSPPKSKALDKDKPISSSLANLINLACCTPCDTDGIVSKYKIPENLDKACPPLVNTEVWRIMDRKGHSQDKGLQDVQSLLTASMIPIIKLAECIKKSDLKTQCKGLISDALTLMGQVQYNLSVKRRYCIRPHLNRKYASICNVSMPITTKLFGDDVSKDLKACDSLLNIGSNRMWKSKPGQQRSSYRPVRGGSYYGAARYQPYQPYQSTYQPPQRGRPFRRGPSSSSNFRGRGGNFQSSDK